MATINPSDAALIRQACRVVEHDPLPKCVEDAYWDYKWARDAIDSSALRLEEIATIIALSGYAKGKGPRTDLKEVSPLDLIKSGAVGDGDPILVSWQYGRPKEGTYRGYAAVREKVLVQFENEPDAREFDLSRILGLPQPAEV